MALVLRVNVQGAQAVRRALASFTSPEVDRINGRWIRQAAFRVQKNAADEQIIRGGGISRRGPERAPDPKRLTSRTGTLRRSIGVNLGPLPRAAEVGTALEYGVVHETGGTFRFGAAIVRRHTRRVAFGRRVAPFQVGPYRRSGYAATYRARPFLQPAVDEESPRFPDLVVRAIDAEVPRK